MSGVDDQDRVHPAVLKARAMSGRMEWEDEAACRGLPERDLAKFYGGLPDEHGREPGVAVRRQNMAMAATFCNEVCPVVNECLQQALEADERFGVRGGTTEAERQRMLVLVRAERDAKDRKAKSSSEKRTA